MNFNHGHVTIIILIALLIYFLKQRTEKIDAAYLKTSLFSFEKEHVIVLDIDLNAPRFGSREKIVKNPTWNIYPERKFWKEKLKCIEIHN